MDTVFVFVLAMAVEAAFIMLYVKRPVIQGPTSPLPPPPAWKTLQVIKRTCPSQTYEPMSFSVCLYQEGDKKFVGIGVESDSEWIHKYGDRMTYPEAKQWFPDLKAEEYGLDG